MKEVIVWSKDSCPNCVLAKNLLELKGIAYEERLLGESWSKEQLLESVPTARSVPQIVIDGKSIGGFTELNELLQGK